jgi:hypothetical protein
LFRLRGMAEGGRPRKGEPILVGERGPEVFIPDREGTVMPLDMPPELPAIVRQYAQPETDELIACPDRPERIRSGTWNTVRYSRKIGKPVTIQET